MTESTERYKYTTGGDKRLLHRRWIGSGSNGHVHEVSPQTKGADIQIYDIPTGKVYPHK